ncbi:hypoxanthine phosphoribosyltransferase [Kamptonema cortianum]|nr:hypoxanthine phosphoribosyltransferase [Geitlerinema splendidum]MDK3158323.1 hypoxanthine phosphoribosyltransferase [Kamptonema cortianum]
MSHRLETLITEAEIQDRVKELGVEIRNAIGEGPIVLLCVLKGAYPFMADLARAISGEVLVDFVQTSSWHGGRSSTGSVQIKRDHDIDIEGHHVVIVEDIVDTGTTLTYLRQLLKTRNPASLRVAAMLDKPEARKHEVHVEHLGFSIPNKFVVGYGLDDNERYRNLPYVAALVEDSP